LAFPLSSAAESVLSPAEAQEKAAEEAASGRIILDGRGLCPGMRVHAFAGVTNVLARWQQARARFDLLLAPYQRNLDALDRLDAEISQLEGQCAAETRKRNEALEADTRYKQVAQRHDIAQRRFQEKSEENSQRVAVTWGSRPSYILAIGCIGVAEWLINYDTLYLFMQVPAIAAGTTLVLGALLAFAAHGHGTLIKQWSHRFGMHRAPRDRRSDWRLLGFSTFCLLVVLATAGGTRYAAALSSPLTNSAMV
jgi:hypothetical protein